MKTAYIKKICDKYQVFSKKGKVLDICDSLSKAEEVLNTIELLSNKKVNLIKKSEDVELSYSAIMRYLNKNYKDEVEHFRSVFKKTFDEANLEQLENADKIALMSAIKSINYNQNKKESKYTERMFKLANSAADIGDADTAGKGIASIVKFLLKKINPMNRQQTTSKLRDRIWNLNELEIASKKSPNSASVGQSISFIKNVLNGRDPKYIREVLRHIVGYL